MSIFHYALSNNFKNIHYEFLLIEPVEMNSFVIFFNNFVYNWKTRYWNYYFVNKNWRVPLINADMLCAEGLEVFSKLYNKVFTM